MATLTKWPAHVPALMAELDTLDTSVDNLNAAAIPSGLRRKLDAIFAGDGLVGIRKWTLRTGSPAEAAVYTLLRQHHGERYESYRLRELGSVLAGAKANYQLDATGFVQPSKSVAWSDASVTAVGGALASNAQALAYGGTYGSTTVASRGVSWVAPANTIRLGIRTQLRSNGGLMLVSINGDRTKANLLPTVQQLVNRGVIDPSVIGTVIGGTAITANDRVIDLEPSANFDSSVGGSNDVYDYHVAIYDGASVGGQTVQVTHTALKNLNNSNTSTGYISAFTYADATFTKDTAAIDLLATRRTWYTTKSAMEDAQSTVPAGATQTSLVGRFHGYDEQTALTFKLDGVIVAPVTDGATLWGHELTVEQSANLYHPFLNAGGTVWATKQTVYRMTADGLMITWGMTPNVNTVVNSGYASMRPLDGWAIGVGWHHNDTADRSFLTGDDSRTAVKTDGMVLWAQGTGGQASNDVAVQWWMPDLQRTLGGFVYSDPEYVGMQDTHATQLGNSKLDKGYAAYSSSTVPQTILAGHTTIHEALHRQAMLPNPALLLSWGT